jgi:hypothetical protein
VDKVRLFRYECCFVSSSKKRVFSDVGDEFEAYPKLHQFEADSKTQCISKPSSREKTEYPTSEEVATTNSFGATERACPGTLHHRTNPSQNKRLRKLERYDFSLYQ